MGSSCTSQLCSIWSQLLQPKRATLYTSKDNTLGSRFHAYSKLKKPSCSMKDKEKELNKSKHRERESAQIFVLQLQDLGFGGNIFKAWNDLCWLIIVKCLSILWYRFCSDHICGWVLSCHTYFLPYQLIIHGIRFSEMPCGGLALNKNSPKIHFEPCQRFFNTIKWILGFKGSRIENLLGESNTGRVFGCLQMQCRYLKKAFFDQHSSCKLTAQLFS